MTQDFMLTARTRKAVTNWQKVEPPCMLDFTYNNVSSNGTGTMTSICAAYSSLCVYTGFMSTKHKKQSLIVQKYRNESPSAPVFSGPS